MREPYPGRKQFADCQSCDLEFEDTKSMVYCQFCGCANCKDCLIKTRNFFMDANELMMQQMETPTLPSDEGSYFERMKREMKKKLDESNKPKRARGKICTLCDRKFLMVS